MTETIRLKLVQAFAPERISVRDDSALHAGHAGARQGGESHFHVSIVSGSFRGVSRVERQRMVYRVLEAEMRQQIHALGLSLLTPEEASRVM